MEFCTINKSFKTECMNTKKFTFNLFLVLIIFSGCSTNVDMWGTGDYDISADFPSLKVVPLNTTETKLKGKWNLQSISSIDSVYSDSSFMKSRCLEFSDSSLMFSQKPLFSDRETGVILRKFPNKYPGQVYGGEYYSPDTSHLKIITRDIYLYPDSALLKIVSLTETKLSLRDTISSFQWNFVK